MRLNTIYNEDCLEGMKRIPDGSVDMILCDLPYGTTEAKWDTVVTLIILAQQNGLTLEECLETAYNEIADRKGKTVNGVFVKEEDL